MKTAIVLFEMILLVVSAGAEEAKPLTIVRTDFDGAFTGWIIQIVDGRYVWDAIASTDGWAEADAGLNRTVRGWYLQSLLGLTWSRSEAGLSFDGVMPQAYALHPGDRIHAETWLVGTLDAQGNSLHVRQLATRSFGQWWLGGQYDLSARQAAAPEHRFGPLLERSVTSNARASLTVQWTAGADAKPTHFLLTTQCVF